MADTKDQVTVDVELIIGVDVSYSMDIDELEVQREGYAQAIVSKEFLQALKTGPNGKLAVTYFDWSASNDQKIIIPWRVIDGPETAGAVAREIMKTPARKGTSTSISGAINFAMPLFGENPNHGLRRVIDISGDGANNNGAPVTGARAALETGITINGLAIMLENSSYSIMNIENLDIYYEDCVIGGPGSFVVSIKHRNEFQEGDLGQTHNGGRRSGYEPNLKFDLLATQFGRSWQGRHLVERASKLFYRFHQRRAFERPLPRSAPKPRGLLDQASLSVVTR
jgi:hypothetical protein